MQQSLIVYLEYATKYLGISRTWNQVVFIVIRTDGTFIEQTYGYTFECSTYIYFESSTGNFDSGVFTRLIFILTFYQF